MPLIFAGSGIAQGAKCIRPVELLDLYPTLIELCGLPIKPELEGHSLAPLLKDARAPWSWPALTSHNQGNHSVRSEAWRYMRYADGSEELYNMLHDPHEWTNVVGNTTFDAVVQEHRQWLPKVDRPPAPGIATWEGNPITQAPRTE